MKKAYIFLTTGVEEMEAVGTIDVLRRGGIDVTSVSMTGSATVCGSHAIPIVADALFEETDLTDADALILPGGGPMLDDYDELKKAIIQHCQAGKLVAAICAAPLVLGGLGLLRGKRATCYPGFEERLIGANVVAESTVTDGNIITGRGPGMVYDFGLKIVEYLYGSTANSDEVAKGMLLK